MARLPTFRLPKKMHPEKKKIAFEFSKLIQLPECARITSMVNSKKKNCAWHFYLKISKLKTCDNQNLTKQMSKNETKILGDFSFSYAQHLTISGDNYELIVLMLALN